MPRRVNGILYSYIKIFAICTFRKTETLFYDEVLFAIANIAQTKHWLVNSNIIFSYKTSSFNFKTIYSKTLDFHLSDMFSRKSLITSCLKRHIIKGTSQIPLDLFDIFDSILLPFLSLHSH